MTFGKVLVGLACAFSSLSVAAPAMAQSGGDLSAGYNLLVTEDDSIPVGWYVDVARDIAPNLGIVGQVTGNYKSEEELGVDFDTNLHSFMGGVRFTGSGAQAQPFAQVLLGAMRISGSTDIEGFDLGLSDTNAALQIGGGLNLRGAGRLGFRVGADYIRVLGDGGGNVFRVAAGILVPFGR